MRSRTVVILALLAGSVNLLPRLLAPPGADVFFHYTLIQCFAEQFWQGDLYPRWCMEANAGLGAPLFLFYFPFPYYITAFLYPLHYLGFGVTSIYLLSLWLANVATAFTCYLWLRDIVSPGRAWLGSLLLLFMPYRMELMLFRSAFAELWGMAWLSLMFLYTRRLAQGRGHWTALAAALWLGLLTHIPLTVMGLLGCAGHIAFSTRRQLVPKLGFAVATIAASLAALFYIAPARYFMNDLNPEGLDFLRSVWVNRAVTIADFTQGGRAPILITLGITLLFSLGLGVLCFLSQGRLPEAARREMRIWAGAALAAFLLLLGAHIPGGLGSISTIIAPWRAQSLIIFATVYFFAAYIQWLAPPKQLNTWKSDYAALLTLFVLLGLFVLNMPSPEWEGAAERAVRERIVSAQEYRSRWTDKPSSDPEYLIEMADRLMSSTRAQVVKGQGEIATESWDWRGIALSFNGRENSRLRLRHSYFPIWQAVIDGQPANALSAEAHSGLMIVDVPAGKHEIRLTRDIGIAMGWRYTLANALSLTALLGLLVAWKRRP